MVAAAEAGALGWREAVHAQCGPTPGAEHGEFYALGGELVATLRAIESLTRVLAVEVAGYGRARVLRDDTGADPALRLEIAAGHLDELGGLLTRAERVANKYWSEIGHVAVEEEL